MREFCRRAVGSHRRHTAGGGEVVGDKDLQLLEAAESSCWARAAGQKKGDRPHSRSFGRHDIAGCFVRATEADINTEPPQRVDIPTRKMGFENIK